MSLFQRSANSVTPASSRRLRPTGPSCRGGASSMLRLAQPASPRQGNLSGWLSRAASVLAHTAAQAMAVQPHDFAPSRWLVGH